MIAARSCCVCCARRRSASAVPRPVLLQREGRPQRGQSANCGGVQPMPYTVTREGGIGEYELDAYVRQLTRWGISLGRAPRAPDPQTGRRWLPVWEERETADKFVQELRAEEDYDDWRIEKVPASAVSEGALGPLDVYVGRDAAGLTYALHPNSRTLVRQRFPHALLLQLVYVGTNDRNDFE